MTVTFTPQFTIAVAIIFIIMFICAGLLVKQSKNNILYVNYAFFTFFFVLMGTRHSILDRLSIYFMLYASVGIAIIIHELVIKIKEEKPTDYIKKYSSKNTIAVVALIMVIVGGGLSIHQYALTMDHHGVVPYDTVFNQPWWPDYIDSLKSDPAPGEVIIEEEPVEVSIEELMNEE
jgi:hypothetical protein